MVCGFGQIQPVFISHLYYYMYDDGQIDTLRASMSNWGNQIIIGCNGSGSNSETTRFRVWVLLD